MTLTLNFQGQIWNLLYLSQKWSDWIFKVKYGICYISTKSGPIATKRKAKYRLNSRPQMWPMGWTLIMTLTFEFSRSNVILTIWWPRSGVRIYQIGTGVTSDVGVPSTRLVRFCLLILLILVAFWLNETFQCVVSVFDGERMTVMVWNLACWYILTTLRTA